MTEAALRRLQAANAKESASIQKRLEDALRRLPIAAPKLPGIPYSIYIPSIARQLTKLPRGERRLLSPAAINRNIARVVSALREVASLSGIADEAVLIEMHETITAGHRLDENAALPELPRPTGINLDALPQPLHFHLIAIGGEAADLARQIEAACPALAAGAKGRRQKTASRAIAMFLYQEIERLTGQPPGRSVAIREHSQADRERGEFVTLLREVFKILGVRASPAEAARDAIEGAKSMGSNQE